MKKVYSKPLISVEVLTLDQPIALNCVADKQDMKDVMGFGYFTQEWNCATDTDSIEWDGDTICYHSNVTQAFLS